MNVFFVLSVIFKTMTPGGLGKMCGSVQKKKYSGGYSFIILSTILFSLFESTANALIIDRLDTRYDANDGWIGNSSHKLNFTDMEGAIEGLDELDVVYSMNDYPWPPGINICAKIVSIIPEEELAVNVKALYYSSTRLELSMFTRDGSSTQIPDGHYLDFSFIDTGYTDDFNDRPITLWREDPNNPGSYYFYADIRDAITNNGGVVPLPTYYCGQTVDSEEVYDTYMIACKFSLADLYLDGEINFKDFSVLANDWQNEDPNIVNVDADINKSGMVDANDLAVLAQEWLLSE